MIRIFNADDTSFNSNGNIVISPLKIIETKKKSLNGWYIDVEVSAQYKEYIQQDMLCVTKSKSKQNLQAFRISNPKLNGRKISFTAHHVVFDAERYFLLDARPTNMGAIGCLNYVNERVDSISPFSFTSNVNSSSTAYFIRKSLLAAWQVIEERWGGVFDADNFNVSFNRDVSVDKGATLNYGVDLQNVEVMEDWSSVVTTLYPTGSDGLMLPEKCVYASIEYEQPYSRTIQFETQIEEEEQTEQLLINEIRENAFNYLEVNQYPRVSYTVKSDVKQNLNIGDLVVVKHPYVQINTQVQEYTYNPVLDRVLSLVFGNYSRDVKKRFDQIKDSIVSVHDKVSKVETLTKQQSDLINSLNKNGLVYIDENEILVLDKLPKNEAKNVWRFGLGGIGFSRNGYEGPYNFAFTQDGRFNASFIAAGSILTNMLSSDVGSSLDLSSNVSLNMIVDDVKKEIHGQNVIYNLNFEEDMNGWKFSGDGFLTFGERLRWFMGMTWNTNAVPIITHSLSKHAIKFMRKGTAISPKGYIVPNSIYSYKARRMDTLQKYTINVLEYDANNVEIKHTSFDLQGEEYEEFSIQPAQKTMFISLEFKILDNSPLVLSEQMFARGNPANYQESAESVKIWVESRFTIVDDSLTLNNQKVDSMNNKIDNATLKLSAEEGVEIWSTNGKGLTIRDSSNEATVSMNTDGTITTKRMVANDAVVNGHIEAVTGKIAGFDVVGNNLKGSEVEISPRTVQIGNAILEGSIFEGTPSLRVGITRLELGTDLSDSVWMMIKGKRIIATSPSGDLVIGSFDRISPMVSGYDIGGSSNRYGTVYLQNQPNVASDERYKSNIQDIDNDLLDAFEEVMPKLFNTEFDNNLHFGYIAQDVERALYKYCLKKYGYEIANEKVKQFAVLSKSESYLSLLYGELTVIKDAYYHREVERLKHQNQALQSELQAIKKFIGMVENNGI